jgi:hypothetical protein
MKEETKNVYLMALAITLVVIGVSLFIIGISWFTAILVSR